MIPCQPHRNNAAGWLKPTGQGMASWRSWRKCYEFGRGVSWLEAPRALHSCGWTKPQANGPVLDQWGTKNVSTSKKRTRILSTLFNIAFFSSSWAEVYKNMVSGILSVDLYVTKHVPDLVKTTSNMFWRTQTNVLDLIWYRFRWTIYMAWSVFMIYTLSNMYLIYVPSMHADCSTKTLYPDSTDSLSRRPIN